MTTDREPCRETARAVVRRFLAAMPLPSREWGPDDWAIAVPGADDRPVDVGIHLGDYTLTLAAFLMRRPPEHQEAIYRWLLQRQAERSLFRFCLDEDDDLAIRVDLLLAGLGEEEVDRILAAIALEHQAVFSWLLRLGWASFLAEEQQTS